VSPNGPGTQGYNPYAYAGNSPVTLTDPSGMLPSLPELTGSVQDIINVIECILWGQCRYQQQHSPLNVGERLSGPVGGGPFDGGGPGGPGRPGDWPSSPQPEFQYGAGGGGKLDPLAEWTKDLKKCRSDMNTANGMNQNASGFTGNAEGGGLFDWPVSFGALYIDTCNVTAYKDAIEDAALWKALTISMGGAGICAFLAYTMSRVPPPVGAGSAQAFGLVCTALTMAGQALDTYLTLAEAQEADNDDYNGGRNGVVRYSESVNGTIWWNQPAFAPLGEALCQTYECEYF
jgi:hypothetical protein